MRRWILCTAGGAMAGMGLLAALGGQEGRFSERALLNSPAPGPHIRLRPGAAAEGKGFSSKDRLVATYYFYWYDDETGAHFRNPDGSDALVDHPANPKGYSYKRPAWHRKELEDILDAGIDVILPVYWGNPADKQMQGALNWSFEGLRALVAAQEKMLAEGRRPPKIGLFYDTSTLQHNAAGHRVNLSTAAGRAWFYVTIRDFFSLIPPKLWATIDGRPLVFLYSAGFASGGTDDPRLVEYVRRRFAEDFGGATPYIVAERSWRIPADSTYAWGAAFGLQVLGVAALGPGYDDHAVPGRTTPKQDREDGAFYRRNWDRLLAMDPARRPNIVVIETWNELHEGTDIAETKEYGRQYIDLTKAYAARWKAGERVKPTGPYADAQAVSLTFGARGRSSGLRLKTGGDGEARLTTAGGAEGIETAPNPFGDSKYLYFDADDTFYYDTGGDVEITVEYFDEGTIPFELHYDSTDRTATQEGAYKTAGSVARRNSLRWADCTFHLKDARFVNRQNQSADFRLATPRGTLKVRAVTVKRR